MNGTLIYRIEDGQANVKRASGLVSRLGYPLNYLISVSESMRPERV